MKRFLTTAACVAVSLVLCAQQPRHLSVEEMFALLDENNNSLRVSLSSVEAASAGIEVAKSQRLPDIQTNLSANYLGNVLMTDRNFSNAHGYSSPHFGNNFALEVSQTVYSGGALTAGVRMAELEKELSAQSMSLTRQQLRFLALGQYFDLYTLVNRQKVYEDNIALTQILIENIHSKYEEGMALQNDVTRYELQLSSLQLGLRKLEDLTAVKNHELCVSLGIADAIILPDPAFMEQVFAPDENAAMAELTWQNEALMSSPAVKMASIDTSIAEQNLKLSKSEYLPKINLFAADSFTGPITFEVPVINQNLNAWYLGVGISWPISALYKSNKKVKRSRLELRQSQERQALTAETLGNNVYEAYTNYQQSFVELNTQEKSVLLAQQNYEVVCERYLSQLALITDMVDASNIRLSAELSLVDARVNVIYSFYKMKYMSGTL